MRRLAAVLLTSTVVLAGAGLSPASAADDPIERLLPRTGLVAPERAPAAAPGTRVIVKDARGDAESDSPGTRLRGAADLRRVSFRTPARAGGTLTFRATWQQLRNADRGGVVQQRAIGFLEPGRGDRFWDFRVGNRRDSFRLVEYDAAGDDRTRIEPEQLDVSYDYGRRGTITVTMSTEWLDARRVSVGSVGLAGGARGFAYDFTDIRTLGLAQPATTR